MTMREMCPEGTVDCPVKSFAEEVQQELDKEEERQCLFNVPVRCHSLLNIIGCENVA